jgi:hypothetical protein
MTSGTDVQIDLFIGEENLLKTLPKKKVSSKTDRKNSVIYF